MKQILLLAFLLVVTMPAFAQAPARKAMPEGEVTAQPICSNLTNRSTVTIQGTITLAPQVLKNGETHQFSDNFKLSPNQTREVCASGPFYEGRRIDLTIRTLFPLFSCKTALGQEIFLDMKQEAATKKYSATCR